MGCADWSWTRFLCTLDFYRGVAKIIAHGLQPLSYQRRTLPSWKTYPTPSNDHVHRRAHRWLESQTGIAWKGSWLERKESKKRCVRICTMFPSASPNPISLHLSSQLLILAPFSPGDHDRNPYFSLLGVCVDSSWDSVEQALCSWWKSSGYLHGLIRSLRRKCRLLHLKCSWDM